MENYCYSTHRQKIPHKLHTGWRNHPREELTKSAPESDPLVKAAAAQRFHCCFLPLYRDVNRRSSGQAGGRNALVKACNTKPSPRENAICSGRTISHLWNLGSIHQVRWCKRRKEQNINEYRTENWRRTAEERTGSTESGEQLVLAVVVLSRSFIFQPSSFQD